MTPTLTRRKFLAASAGATLAASLAPRAALNAAERKRSVGANDRIRIGLIGTGARGINVELRNTAKFAQEENLEVVAVCDPWSKARGEAAAKAKEWMGKEPRICRTARELLDFKEVDAVFITSPDHWHARHLEWAAQAGKHIYMEKPMAIGMDELNRCYDAAKKCGTVIQVGTQMRSSAPIHGCREFLKSSPLGKNSRIEQVRGGDKPYWYLRLKTDVRKEDVDWDEFAGGRTQKPFDSVFYSAWYGYWEFSQGPVPQLGVHFLDNVHYMAGLGFPETCVCLGGTYTWIDEHRFTVPDHVQALWTYPEGLMVSYVTNFGNSSGQVMRLAGDKGTLEMGFMGEKPTYSAVGAPRRDGSIRGVNEVPPVEIEDHWLNWFRCMRSGAQPNAPLDAGYQHSVASIMATVAYETGRRTRFDAKTRRITLD
jgi:predicted dehydrogenase